MNETNRICKICDGGPGNNSACYCGVHAWEETIELDTFQWEVTPDPGTNGQLHLIWERREPGGIDALIARTCLAPGSLERAQKICQLHNKPDPEQAIKLAREALTIASLELHNTWSFANNGVFDPKFTRCMVDKALAQLGGTQ